MTAKIDNYSFLEKELEFAKLEIANLHDDIHEWMDKCDALRAKIERMEQPAPGVPERWLHHAARMAALARKLREPDWHFESIRDMQRELCALEEAALAAAPEAKT